MGTETAKFLLESAAPDNIELSDEDKMSQFINDVETFVNRSHGITSDVERGLIEDLQRVVDANEITEKLSRSDLSGQKIDIIEQMFGLKNGIDIFGRVNDTLAGNETGVTFSDFQRMFLDNDTGLHPTLITMIWAACLAFAVL